MEVMEEVDPLPYQVQPSQSQLDPSPSQLGDSAINSYRQNYTPEVRKDFIPRINQEFDNLNEVHAFYNNYAKELLFSIRNDSSKKSREGEIIRKEYVCYKQGVRDQNPNPILRRRGLTRGGCRAKLAVVKKGEKFVVSQFFEGHNHILTSPKKVHLLRSHRKIGAAQRALTETLAAVNIPISQRMSLLEVEAGGLQNVGFISRDLYNAERDRRISLAGHDANMLKEHFELVQQKNPSFFFTIKKDEDGRMSHCFWADATSTLSYKYFGDVGVFDTTYNTNRYSLIFAPILGVNHHGQTTVFGCAFLTDETCESFEWLFKEWLKAMPAGPPKMIITDQDAAMTKAIANVLPNTFHRYCIWHITNKFSEEIGPIAYQEHSDDLKACIWNSESPQDFEERWVDVVDKTKLCDNDWLRAMYRIRDRWVPAFTRHIFSAHMTSSQRAESNHAFFKRYVAKQNSLLDFVTRFDRAMEHLRHKELNLDHKDVNEEPQLKTASTMESKVSELYTCTIFHKFQGELFQNLAYMVKKTEEDEHHCWYNVKRTIESGSKGRVVMVDKSSDFVSCSCKMFESDGIACRHILAYFIKKTDIIELPDQYIMQRWTKATKASRVMDDLGVHGQEICDTPLLIRRHRLLQLAHNVVEDGVLDEQGTQVVQEGLDSIKMKLAVIRGSREQGRGSGIRLSVPLTSELAIKEPLKVRAKGCGKRLKGGKEKAIKKRRRCTGCGGQSHDKRNCPKFHNISLQDIQLNEDDDDDDDQIDLHDCS